MLDLKKPIVFFDIESTGTDIREDRIIELGLLKVLGETYTEHVYVFDPGVDIPAESSAIHGFTDEDVVGKPKFEEKAEEIHKLIAGCDLGGFNLIRFDIPMLHYHLQRAGIEYDWSAVNVIDVGNIFKRMNPRTLSAAVQNYLGREHEDAHGAMEDTEATWEVFEKMLEQHTDMGENVPEIALYSNYGVKMMDVEGKFYEQDGEIYFNFGKFRGQLARNNVDYLEWMVGANFANDTKEICRKVMMGDVDAPVDEGHQADLDISEDYTDELPF